jgi:hypothetical protein
MVFSVVAFRQLWSSLLVGLLLTIVYPNINQALATSVALSWVDSSSNETGFRIERMPGSGSYTLLAMVGSNITGYTDTAVTEGSSYCYRVSAYNSSGVSDPSNSACVQVPTITSGTSGGTTGSGSTGDTTGTTTTTPTVSYIGGKWKNYQMSLSIRPQSSGDTGVMFRYLDSDNFYRFVWDADNKDFRLEVRSKGITKILTSKNNGIRGGRFYPLKVTVNGAQIVIAFDGKQIFSVTDSTIAEGQVALYSSSSPNSAFDNVVVTDLQTGNVLLQDDFRTAKVSGWTIIDEASNGPSNWTAVDGYLKQTSSIGDSSDGGFGTFALYTQGNWTNYRATLHMKSMDDDTIGVLFRYKDNNNYYRFSWDDQEQFRRLEKRVNGTFTTLASDTALYTVGHDYQVTIVANGNQLQVLVDGQLAFSVTDSMQPKGTIALYSRWNNGAIFDNILLENLQNNAVLLWDDFNDGNFTGWTIIDDAGTTSGPSDWSVVNGTLVQSANIGSNSTGKPGTFVLY